jgi:hypothetical protein
LGIPKPTDRRSALRSASSSRTWSSAPASTVSTRKIAASVIGVRTDWDSTLGTFRLGPRWLHKPTRDVRFGRGWRQRRYRLRSEAASFPGVNEPRFHFVCSASALVGLPAEWVTEMLGDGEIALLADGGGLEAINEVAHTLGLISIPVVRREATSERQQVTVVAYADRLPLVWVGEDFTQTVADWARDRGPMTLLVQASGPLSADERRRIDRFVAILGRQAE